MLHYFFFTAWQFFKTSSFQNLKTTNPSCQQPRIALSIMSRLLNMLSSVHFDDDSFFQTDEIHNVTAQWLLPPKFVATKLPQTQLTPQQSLSIRGVIAQVSGAPS